MGSYCSRRRTAVQLEEWILVDQLDRPNLARFKKAVRKVIVILVVRKIWSRIGRWLQDPSNRQNSKYKVLKKWWNQTSRTVIQPRSQLFDHVQRRSGKLEYK